MVFYEIRDNHRFDDGTSFTAAVCDEDSDYAFELTAENGRTIRLSKGMFQRVALEFTSPDWVFRTAIDKIRGPDAEARGAKDEAEPELGVGFEQES